MSRKRDCSVVMIGLVVIFAAVVFNRQNAQAGVKANAPSIMVTQSAPTQTPSQDETFIGFQDLAWSPDGSKIAVASGSEVCHVAPEALDQFAIKIMDSVTGTLVTSLVGHHCPVTSVAWGSDSVQLMSAALDGVKIWDTVTGSSIYTSGDKFAGQQAAYKSAWSPVNNHVATVGYGAAYFVVWDAATGEWLRAMGGNRPTISVAWSPDGNQVASGSEDGTVTIWNPVTSEILLTFHHNNPDDEPVYSVAWSPDGSRLVSAGRDKTVRVWDTNTGTQIREIVGHTELINMVAWSPDGKLLASASNDKTVRVWNADTGMQTDIFEASSAVWALAWSPDGSEVAYGGTGSDQITIVTPAQLPKGAQTGS